LLPRVVLAVLFSHDDPGDAQWSLVPVGQTCRERGCSNYCQRNRRCRGSTSGGSATGWPIAEGGRHLWGAVNLPSFHSRQPSIVGMAATPDGRVRGWLRQTGDLRTRRRVYFGSTGQSTSTSRCRNARPQTVVAIARGGDGGIWRSAMPGSTARPGNPPEPASRWHGTRCRTVATGSWPPRGFSRSTLRSTGRCAPSASTRATTGIAAGSSASCSVSMSNPNPPHIRETANIQSTSEQCGDRYKAYKTVTPTTPDH